MEALGILGVGYLASYTLAGLRRAGTAAALAVAHSGEVAACNQAGVG